MSQQSITRQAQAQYDAQWQAQARHLPDGLYVNGRLTEEDALPVPEEYHRQTPKQRIRRERQTKGRFLFVLLVAVAMAVVVLLLNLAGLIEF